MGLKDFYIQPGAKQIVYTKQGWETMASIKTMELFDKDCILGEDITATWRFPQSMDCALDEDTPDASRYSQSKEALDTIRWTYSV